MISIIHPSRGRPQKSFETIRKWQKCFMGCTGEQIETIVSVDMDDFTLNAYIRLHGRAVLLNNNRSAVDAINNAAKVATGDILIVVSDDTEPVEFWNKKIHEEVNGKTDWILKTQDGIQPWIITMPVLDRAYYNRFGYIYHPDFSHMFCDTYMTCVADINGRKLTSDLMFKHNHYSASGGKEAPDAINKKNDATWSQGEETFIRLMKEFTPEEISKIQDPGMKNWLRNKGVK